MMDVVENEEVDEVSASVLPHISNRLDPWNDHPIPQGLSLC